MRELILPKPTAKQKQFLNDGHRYLAFGGSRGGGKSFAVRMDAVMKAETYKGIRIIIVRRTYPELVSNHIQPLIEWLKCYSEGAFASYNDARKEIRFPNGSTILFRYCDNDKDAERFQGTECDVLYVDEATQQPEERMKRLTACVRGVNSFPKLVRYTCNPGGIGHGWIKRLFIDRQFGPGERPEDYSFIQSSVYDNVPLMRADPGYIAQLEALPPHLRSMWLEGNWDVFSGQFFEEFRIEPDVEAARQHGCLSSAEELQRSRRWVHVIDPFPLNEGQRLQWTLFRSYDFGYGKPFSCAWWAVDPDGVFYRVFELYGKGAMPNEGCRWTVEQQFEEIARIECEHPWFRGRTIYGVADPSIWDASRGDSIAGTAMRYGLHFEKGDNKRIPGWMQCHYRLRFDSNGYPMMYVFRNCEDFIRTIPLLVYDEHRPEDLDTNLEDHAADEWRYACMSRPIVPPRETEEPVIYRDPLDRW